MAYKQKRNPFKKMSTMLAEGAGAAETPGRDFRAPTKKLTPLNKGIAKEKTFEEEEGKSQPMSIDGKTPDKELMAATGAGEATSEKITTDPPERDLENPPDPDREDGGYDDDGGPPDVPHPSEIEGDQNEGGNTPKNPDEDPPRTVSKEDAQKEKERFQRQKERFEARNPGYTIDEKGFVIPKKPSRNTELQSRKTEGPPPPPMKKLGADKQAWQNLHDGKI